MQWRLRGALPDILREARETLEILQQDYLRPLPDALAPALGGLVLCLMVLATRRHVSPTLQGSVLTLLTLAALLAAYFLLAHNLRWLPFSTLLTLWLFYAACALEAYFRERRQREHALQLFGRFVDPRVVSALVAGDTLAQAQAGQSQEITVLFSDIRGFTSLSETSSPEHVVQDRKSVV